MEGVGRTPVDEYKICLTATCLVFSDKLMGETGLLGHNLNLDTMEDILEAIMGCLIWLSYGMPVLVGGYGDHDKKMLKKH